MKRIVRLTENDLTRIVKRVIQEQLDADYQKQIQDLTNITNSPSGQKAAADYRKGQRDLEIKRKREKEKLMSALIGRTNIIDLFKKMGLVEGFDNLIKIGVREDEIKTIKMYAKTNPVYSTRGLVVFADEKYTYVIGKFPRQKYGDIYLSCKSTGYATNTVRIATNRTDCMKRDILNAMYSKQELDKMSMNIQKM